MIKPIAKEADDALESLVDSGVPIEVRMRRQRTFLWMALCLAGMTTRKELLV